MRDKLSPEHLARIRAVHGEWLYHVTNAENLSPILREGLRSAGGPSRWKARQLRPGCIYFASQRKALRHLLAKHWGDAVIAVRINDLEPTRWRADTDVWRPFLRSGELEYLEPLRTALHLELDQRLPTKITDLDQPEALMQGLILLDTIAYAVVVPPQLLHLAFVPPRRDIAGLSALRATWHASPDFGQDFSDPTNLAKIADSPWWRVPLASF